MTNKNIKDIIDSRLQSVCVSEELEEKILSGVSVIKKKARWTPAVAYVCLCIIFAVPVLAATVPSFTTLVSKIGSRFGEQLQPINLVCEDNGIKMEVVAAMNDDETVYIYLTLQDLTGNRIDKSIGLYEYQIKCGDEYMSALPEIVAYDEVSNTATVRLLSNIANQRISTFNGRKITIYVESFISHKQEFDDIDTEINLAEVTNKVNTVKLDIDDKSKSTSSQALLQKLEEQKIINILKPNELCISIPGVDFAYISNMGIIDNRLHVQLRKNYNTTRMSISGYIALIADSVDAVKDNDYFTVDWDNDIHLNRAEINFYTDEKGNIIDRHEGSKVYSEYSEIIYDVNPDILANCKLIAKFFSVYQNYTECNLKTTFKVDALKDSKFGECDIDLGGIRLSSISVSPFGIIAFGSEDDSYNVNMNISVTMEDGSVREFGASKIGRITDDNGNTENSFSSSTSDNPNILTSTNHGSNGEFSIKYICREPLDFEKVVSVTINGNTVTLK